MLVKHYGNPRLDEDTVTDYAVHRFGTQGDAARFYNDHVRAMKNPNAWERHAVRHVYLSYNEEEEVWEVEVDWGPYE